MHILVVHVYDMIRLHCLLSFTVCTHEDLGVVDIIPDERCPGLHNSAQFTGGFVCYSGVTPGSVAIPMFVQLNSSFGGFQIQKMPK